MRFVLLLTGILAVLLVAVLLFNTLRLPNHQLVAAPAAPKPNLDQALTVEHLAGALRIPSVSHSNYAETDTVPFSQLLTYYAHTFPLVHQRLGRHVVNDFGLLYEWKGSDPSLKPLLLLAHQDVVPVAAGTEKDWTRPPFAGQVAEGFLYGRGALDDKLNVIGQLEAVEYLLRTGYTPKRTVLLAFGHDEETQGTQGAAALAALLERTYPKLEMVLDEGGLIKTDGVAGITQPVALVGVSEKGYMSLELTAQGQSGHSSMPPDLTSIGRVSAAVAKLEANPFPARLDAGAGALLSYLAPAAPFGLRLVFANQWLLGSFVKKKMLASPSTAAALRTTTAPTIIRGGDKDNVLPASAVATVNFRLLPGDSVASVIARVKELINNPQIKVSVPGAARAATPVSRTDNAAFTHLHQTIKSVFPQALVAPYVVLGATDARSYAHLAPEATYRFMPLLMDQNDIERLHGTNERIGTAAYQDVIRFYVQLLRTEF
jgi:carboxypeptidase PM20D1